jgi:hypothetical protein
MVDGPDDKLAEVVGRVPGVRVTHHYRGRGRCVGTYYVHFTVDDPAALDRVIEWGGRINSPVHIYGSSKTRYAYALLIGEDGREILLSEV